MTSLPDRPPDRDNYARRNHRRQERLKDRLGDTIDMHRCGRVHRSPRTFLQCILYFVVPLWVVGDGQWALFSYCGRGLTVSLYPNRARAERIKAQIDDDGCGAYCDPEDGHEIHNVNMVDPVVLPWWPRSSRRRGGGRR